MRLALQTKDLRMSPKYLLSALTAVALCAAAPAQNALSGPASAPPPGPHRHFDKAEMEKFHARLCERITPRAIGRLAELEASLNPTAKQKPLFERWKTVKLTEAKNFAAACAAMKGPERDAGEKNPPLPSARLKLQEKFLADRLAAVKAELPALEALEAGLTDEQKQSFARLRHEGFFGRMDGGRMGGAMHHGPHDGMRGGPGMMHAMAPDAPPPPEN
jgi:hypothetical protein